MNSHESLSASFSSENESEGGQPARWHCTPPLSTAPSGETPSHPGHVGQGGHRGHGGHGGHRSQPRSRSRSPLRLASQSPAPSSSKRWSPKPTNMRRNIRKLLRDHQLDAVTKVAQQEELERKHRPGDTEEAGPPWSPAALYTAADSSRRVADRSHADSSRRVAIAATVTPQEVACSRQEAVRLDPRDVRKYDGKGNGTTSTAVAHTHRAADSSRRVAIAATVTPQEVACSRQEAVRLDPRDVRKYDGKGNGTTSTAVAHTHRAGVIALRSGEEGGKVATNKEENERRSPPSRGVHVGGAHANDALNQPDAHGQVLVNVDHPRSEPDIYLSPQLARTVKPHQIGGIRFLYENLMESVERFNAGGGFGCILAHSMGLGKTLQVISFIDVNTLHNWLSEFNMWVPPPEALPPDTDPSLLTPRTFKVHILNDEHNMTMMQQNRHFVSGLCVIALRSGEEGGKVATNKEENERRSPPSRGVHVGGAHANDALNQPDAHGQVLVNVDHPRSEPDIYLSPQLARTVKPHQIGGIRFLYENLMESVERFNAGGGFGCILAHSMGLGKTLQVISFIDVLLRHTSTHTVLAIVPVNTLHNWLSEFNMWVPPPEALPPDTDPSLLTPRTFKVHILNDEHKTMAARAKVVEEWASEGGVLLMGYEMYRLLSMKKGVRALSRPGPDVVICDEGHRIKNCHASTSRALKNIRTSRRVVLTGYPLQNNLMAVPGGMVDFVRPKLRWEFSNMFERPILNGQCVDRTAQDLQLMRYRSHVLHSLLAGFVQRRGHDAAEGPTAVQGGACDPGAPRALYTKFMNRFQEAGSAGWLSLNPLKAFCVCCKIWNHPDVLYEALQKESLANEQDLDLDDMASARCQNPANPKTKALESPNPIGGLSLNQLQEKANQVITYEWAKDIMADYDPGLLENSAKMVVLFQLIEESVRKGDKILVFSQSLSTLTVIEEFLAKRPVPPSPKSSGSEGTNQNWVRNLNYCRLDGSTAASERERLINQFNDPSNTSAWVFLLSTRAGCLGVNLIGANRVVVFDASWNPCHDAQAVCRVYRYGQRKPCHIYRLVCDYTLEKKIYDRQTGWWTT
ncbi:hypothetical protein CRUP_014467 [Coryphaenoides rupestris]|nr:hypothetical protein CRUP_014467 [Coryphaenoides rupestris]